MPGESKQAFFSLPDQTNYEIAYGLAFRLAVEKLLGLPDISAQCLKSESVCLVDNVSSTLILKYLGRTYQVSLPQVAIRFQDSAEEVELRDKILILHYLTGAKGTPLSQRLIAFQELIEGANYYPSFIKRAIKPLLDNYGTQPDKLLELSREMEGNKAEYGDFAVTIPAFARVPITLVFWKGDSEFPPNANILFDSTILDYLSAEDVNVVCQTIAWRLVKSLKSQNTRP